MKENNNPATVEQSHNAPEIEQTATNPTHDKATAILRARIEPLATYGLNFEKRTGAFFKATMVTDDKGTEKLSRKVVEDAECPEDAHEAMRVKRASALVVSIEEKRTKMTKAIEEANRALQEARANAEALEIDYSNAVALVEAFELPEKAQRVKLSAKIEAQATLIEKMRAALIAAGLDPDELA